MKLSSDQLELQSAVRRVFEETITPEYRRDRITRGIRSDAALELALKELGLDEGFSGEPPIFGSVELAAISVEAGRVLLPEPICERIAVSSLASRYMTAEDRQKVPADTGFAIAPASCCDLTLSGSTVRGSIAWLVGSAGAQWIVAHAASADGQRAVVLEARGAGVALEQCSSVDQTTALASAAIDGTPVAVLSSDASRLIEGSLELVWASVASGICSKVIEMTVAFVTTREQFGVPIGGFQAVQHKLASVFAESEALRALAQFAAWSFDSDPSQRLFTCGAAGAYAAAVAPKVCESALQCHGGIGFTWEYDLHLYLRRAKLIEAAFSMDGTRAATILAAARAVSEAVQT